MKVLSLPVSKQKEATQARPTPTNAGCPHGGHEDNAAKPCDACYMTALRAADRFSLWAPVPPATLTRKRHAV
jgi:hypothetical protein